MLSKLSLRKASVALCCLAATACTNPVTTSGNYASPIGGAPVLDNPTPYSQALSCLSLEMAMKGRGPATVTVGKILDYTGKEDLETGKRLTQGAALMAMSALGKAKIPQVERFDTSVTELELKWADNKLIGDPASDKGYRAILAGQIEGSDYHVIGGITEMNYNIRSNNAEVLFDLVSAGGRVYVMNVGIDLRLVDSRTLRVVDTVSYQKQIIGREVRAGVFEFFGNKVFDLGLGERSLEPIQLAVRSVIERATFELMRDLHKLPRTTCSDVLDGGDRNLGSSAPLRTARN
ncbi:MAG: holdfast anchoring protein HfaB [Geminicoccaceae bacterium]